MSGPTLAMASAVESSSSRLPQSHSTPDLMSLSSYSRRPSLGKKSPKADKSRGSFDLDFDDSFELDTSFSLGRRSESVAEVGPGRPSDPEAEPEARPSQQQPLRRSRAGSLMERPRSWFPSSKSATRETHSQQLARPTTSDGGPLARDGLARSSSRRSSIVQDSLANFAKRSWLSSPSSPSPKHRPSSSTANTAGDLDSEASQKLPLRRRGDLTLEPQSMQTRQSEGPRPAKPFTRATSYLDKIKSKQPMVLRKVKNGTDSDSCASSAVSLGPPASHTTEARTSQSTSRESNTTATDDSSADMSPHPPQNKDPLWSSFKNLEVEYKGFTLKSTPQRIVQVQTILLPFLRSTMDHSSTREIVPEDVDRRATILSKWWSGLLDMMDGIGMASIPGVDRPIIFDALTAIMMRPEWRQTTSYFLPLDERSPRERVRLRAVTNASESTDESDQAAFLAKSAEHNVRTMFIAGLVKQLNFVVVKMAMRHVPLVLVSFAGKACAYAFFFVPGVADILVRLWDMGPDLIRRTADGLGLSRVKKGESDNIVALFPPKLAAFGWTSPKAMWNTIKQVPRMPVLISRIPWMGPWVSRWKGRDTDLLFVFYKQFHILADDFVPSGLPLAEKARAPGFVIVHAQLLSIVDDTIHRHSAMGGPITIDPMPGADASAMAMPMPPPNLMKGMSENNLLMLLRDILADDTLEIDGAKHTFAETCVALIKTAVRRTSQFDNAACFTLCDFLEEALPIYDNFEDTVSSKKYIDWLFWLDVFKKILCSSNTMSEVRVLSFIFSIWDMVAENPARKAAICLDWLLTEEVFNALFNHWCPMVRAYYHRLLCWRICRCEGDADEIDTKIFLVVAARLKTTWTHYLYLKDEAEEAGRSPPSTAPTVPTPGKKFMIIRQEVNQPQPGLFVNFDSIAKTSGSEVISAEDLLDDPPAKSEPKSKWSLLGKVLTLGSGPGDSARGHRRNVSWDEEFENARRETAELRSRAKHPSRISLPGRTSESDSACSSPLYEEQKYVFRFFLAWHQPAMPPRERMLHRPRLPGPAEAITSLHPHSIVDEPPAVTENAHEPTNGTMSRPRGRVVESVTLPVKPTGIFAKNAVYSGRALAEWSQVIWECNNFVDRRRDEGIPGLHEVEVPMLGVESFRKPCG